MKYHEIRLLVNIVGRLIGLSIYITNFKGDQVIQFAISLKPGYWKFKGIV